MKSKQDTDPDQKISIKNRKDKHNDEGRHKKTHADKKCLEEAQNETHPKEIRRQKHLEEESIKQRCATVDRLETDNKSGKHVEELQSEKHKPQPRKERLPEEQKKLRHVEEVREETQLEETQLEEPKRRSCTDEVKRVKHREENRHERPPSEPQREKPADVHRPLFER